MTRFTSTSMEALASDALVAFRLLVDVGVTSGSVYVCTGRHYIYTMGNTYSPVGTLADISPVQEETDAFPRDVTLRMAAVSSADRYEPLRESMFNRSVVVYRTFLDPATFTLTTTPEKIWYGKIAAVQMSLGGAPEVEINVISSLKKTASVRYFNTETFRSIDSSDTFGTQAANIPLFKSQWGQQPTLFSGVQGNGAPAGANPAWNPSWRTPYRP